MFARLFSFLLENPRKLVLKSHQNIDFCNTDSGSTFQSWLFPGTFETLRVLRKYTFLIGCLSQECSMDSESKQNCKQVHKIFSRYSFMSRIKNLCSWYSWYLPKNSADEGSTPGESNQKLFCLDGLWWPRSRTGEKQSNFCCLGWTRNAWHWKCQSQWGSLLTRGSQFVCRWIHQSILG